MDARTERVLLQLCGLFLAAGAGDAIVQFAVGPTYDYRHLLGALVAAAVMAAQEYLKNTGNNAPPTVGAVNAALHAAVDNPIVSVPPPKVRIPREPRVID